MGKNSIENTGETGLWWEEKREVDHGRLMDSVSGVPTGLNTLCLDTFVNLQTGPHASGHTLFHNTQHSLANYMS